MTATGNQNKPSSKLVYKSLVQYSRIISDSLNINDAQAIQVAQEFLRESIAESSRDKMDNLPDNFGNILIGKENTDDEVALKIADSVRSEFPKIKAEGVTDFDIQWWWNLTDVDRRMIKKIDANSVVFLFTYHLDRVYGESPEERALKASKIVRKLAPVYGDPDDTRHSKGNDRPLPYELKERINTYTMRRTESDFRKFKREMDNASSFNSLIRKEIKKSNL